MSSLLMFNLPQKHIFHKLSLSPGSFDVGFSRFDEKIYFGLFIKDEQAVLSAVLKKRGG